MGYDVYMVDENGNSVEVERFYEGETCPVGGCVIADIGIAYNYAEFFYDTIDKEIGIRWIYNRPMNECIERLETAISILGTDKDDDYWKATAGNAGHALKILLGWARNNPECHFEGD